MSWALAPGRGRVSSPESPGVGAHQLVDLGEGRVLDVQAVCGDPVQGCVVQHHLGGTEGDKFMGRKRTGALPDPGL